MLLAMAGGAFLYKRAFEKEKLFFSITRIDLICSEKNGISVAFDPYIDVHSKDSLLFKDAEPKDVFIGKDSIVSLALKVQSAGVWTDVSNDASTAYSEIDAATGKTVKRTLSLDEWRRKYNRHPQSTLLKREFLQFSIPSDTGIATIALQMRLSDNKTLTDTCRLK